MIIKLSNKRHYTIGEIAKAFDVNTSLIRYWEGEFAILNPKKDKRGNRQFEEKDIEKLKLIYSLVKEQGFTLEGAKEYLKHKLHKVNRQQEIINKLESIKGELLKIKAEL
ncbi:MAG: MerR family transcriptional regulator [Flavobacteriales bacterium]|nr:MerR family transcriptional regulator [Flavobacteriales bacterium]